MEFTDFRTAQKMKFSIKDFFSKCDQTNASFSENFVNILTEWSTSALEDMLQDSGKHWN